MKMKLLLATSNPGKVSEIKALLADRGIEVVTQADLGISIDVVEDAETLEGNAIKKARALAEETGLAALADDTGLEVEALAGQPGVFSARYAGPEEDAVANRAKMLVELDGREDRSARFRTVVAFVNGDQLHTFDGICDGSILDEEVGDKGFGYDPIFRPSSSSRSFAEMSVEEKNRISHRAVALRKFADFIGGTS